MQYAACSSPEGRSREIAVALVTLCEISRQAEGAVVFDRSFITCLNLNGEQCATCMPNRCIMCLQCVYVTLCLMYALA